MATVTHRVGTAATTNVTSYVSGSFTPAVGDLLVAFVHVSGSNIASTFTTSAGITFTQVDTSLNASSANTLFLFVANSLVTAATAQTGTFDCTGDAGTGAIIDIYSVSGMTLTGAAAVRQTNTADNAASGTPSIAFVSTTLTGNPTFGAIANATNPATLTPPTGWTEGIDTGYATPATGLETVYRASGFAGTTMAWGSSSASAYGAMIVEMNTNAPPTVALNAPANASSTSDTTPELDFTGTDPDANDLEYQVQVATDTSFTSSAATLLQTSGGSDRNGTVGDTSTIISLASVTGGTALIVAVSQNGTTSQPTGVTDNLGNTYTRVYNGTNLSIWYATNVTGGAINVAVAFPSTNLPGKSIVEVYNYSGLTASGFDVSVGATGTSTTPSSGATAATAQAAELVFGASTTTAALEVTTLGSGYGNLQLQNSSGAATNYTLATEDKSVSSIGSQTATFGFPTSTSWEAAVATFKTTAGSNVVDKTSTTDTGFLNTVNGADTHPFTSGQKVGYTVQSALAAGTYYWRVRAVDPSGSNVSSAWTTAQSFTITAGAATLTRTHTTDTLKRKLNTKTHTTDVFKHFTPVRAHSTDLNKTKSGILRTHSTDTLKRATVNRAHTTSVNKLKSGNIKSHTTDVFKTARFTRAHTTDTVKRGISTKSHSADTFKRIAPTRTHSTDTNKRVVVSRVHSTDTLKRRATTKNHSTDLNKRKSGILRTHTTDAFRRSAFAKIHTTDVLIHATLTRNHFTDTVKRKSTIKTHTTDVLKRSVSLRTHSTDINKTKSGITRVHNTDVNKRKAGILRSHTTDSVLRKSVTKTHTTDVVKRGAYLRNHLTDTLKRKAVLESHTTDINKLKSGNIRVHATDALKRKATIKSHSSDVTKRKTTTRVSTTDVLKRAQKARTHSTDVLKRATVVRSHTTSVVKRKIGSLSHTTSSVKRQSSTLSHSTDVYTTSSLRYWVGGDGLWTDTAHWSYASGGAGGASVPNEVNDVIFDQLSTTLGTSYVVDLTGATVDINSFYSLDLDQGVYLSGDPDTGTILKIRGGVQVSGNMSSTNLGLYLAPADSSTYTLSTPSLAFNRDITIDAGSATYEVQNDISTTTNDGRSILLWLKSGSLLANSRSISANNIKISDGFNLDITGGVLSVYDHILEVGATATITGLNSAYLYFGGVTLPDTTTDHVVQLYGSNFTPDNITIGYSINQNPIYINGSLTASQTFNFNPGHFYLTPGATYTSAAFSFGGYDDGTTTYPSLVHSQIPGEQYYLNQATGEIAGDYIDVQDSNVGGGTIWHTLPHFIDSGNNTGWVHWYITSHGTDIRTRAEAGDDFSTLVEDFSAPLDYGKWDEFPAPAGPPEIVDGKAKIQHNVYDGDGNWIGQATLKTASGYNLVGSHVQFEIPSYHIDPAATDAHFYIAFLDPNSVDYAFIDIAPLASDTNIHGYFTHPNNSPDTVDATIDLSTMLYFRASVVGETFYLEASTDGLSWSPVLSNTIYGWSERLILQFNGYDDSNSADSYYYVDNINISSASSASVSHTTDVINRSRDVVVHATDVNKRKINAISHTTSVNKRKLTTKTHTTDTLKRKSVTRTHITDVLKRATISKTYTTDLLKRSQRVKTHTTDVLKRAAVVKTHSTDINKRRVTTRAHSTDLNKRLANIQRSHTSDTLKRSANLRSHTTDVLRRAVKSLSHLTDVFTRRQLNKSHSTDTLKRKVNTRAHTTDLNKLKSGNVRSHLTDVLKRIVSIRTHSTDVNKRKSGITRSHTTDTNLRKAGISRSHTTDTFLRLRVPLSHSTNVVARKVNTRTHTTDVYKRSSGGLFHATDINLRKTTSKAHSTDTLMRMTHGRNYVYNGDFELGGSTWPLPGWVSTLGGNVTVNPIGGVGNSAAAKITVDAVGTNIGIAQDAAYRIKPISSGTWYQLSISVRAAIAGSIDYAIYARVGGTTYYLSGGGVWLTTYSSTNVPVPTSFITTTRLFQAPAGADLIWLGDLKRGGTGTQANNSYVFDNISIIDYYAHTTDVVKRKQNTRVHSTDVNKRQAFNVSHSTSIVLRAARSLVHTTSVNKRKVTLLTHSTSVNKTKSGLLRTHSTDILKRKFNTVSHSTSVNKRKANIISHTTDLLKRVVNSKAHSTDINKRKSGIFLAHTTDTLLRKAAAKFHLTDVLKRKLNITLHRTDVNKRAIGVVAHKTSIVKRLENTLSHSTDISLKNRAVVSHGTDTNKRKAKTVHHSTNINISGARVRRHTTDVSMRDSKGEKRILWNGQWINAPVMYLKNGKWIKANVTILIDGVWTKTER